MGKDNKEFNICFAKPVGTPLKNKYDKVIRPFVTSYEELVEFCKPLYDEDYIHGVIFSKFPKLFRLYRQV